MTPIKKTSVLELVLPEASRDGKKGFVLLPGESVRFPYGVPRRAGFPVRRLLRVVGESDVFWPWRCEVGFPFQHYQSIADALETGVACDEAYCLHLKGGGEDWPRSAYAKVSPGAAAGRRVNVSVRVKVRNVRVVARGELGVEFGLYLARPGRAQGDVFDPPDVVHRLELPRGTCGWTRLARSITLPATTDVILVRITGRRFRGDAWIGSPRLFLSGQDTLIPPLVPNASHWPHLNWLGENLSRAEWPEFELRADGKKVWSGACFSPVVRAPDFSIPLPDLQGRGSLELKLVRTHDVALPFVIRRAEVHEESARPVEVVAFPEYVPEGRTFPVLIERNGRGRSRLDVVSVDAGPARTSPSFAVGLGGTSVILKPRRVVRRGQDDLTLSTGDAVYVPQTREAFLDFIAWYMTHRIGNAMCFRPVYRWCGSRSVDPAAWEAAVTLLGKLGLKYHLMVDGRELPGMAANPPDALLAGANYMGRQAHEQDGAFCYWGGQCSHAALFTDLLHRGKDNGGIMPAVRPPVRRGNSVAAFFDNDFVRDMKEGADYFVANLKQGKGVSTRHTGPSTLFRYFFQAGYEWVGAEQMYSAEEVVLAAARGASAAYGKAEFGAHLAVQWSSSPHDTQAHADRYFLALATCYMQGVGNLNTEEGLYRMESEYADHDRFSNACAIHREAHAKLRRFMETHTRRGSLRVPVAMLQGRNCAWRCFSRGPAWNSSRPEFAFGSPEESFDLLKVFYPRSVLDAIYVNGCSDDQPFGWYTGTPFGPVDLLPVEAPAKVLRRYGGIAFLGWNTFAEGDFEALAAYVEEGGTLLLTKPQLSTEVRRQQPAALPDAKCLAALLGRGWPRLSGRMERAVGRGRVIYYGDDLYPCDRRIRAAYERDLARLGRQAADAERQRGWVEGNEDISFTAYDWDDGRTRTLYLLNTDWWSRQRSHAARLLLGTKAFEVPVPFGQIVTLTVRDGIAVLPEAPDADVLEVRVGTGEVAVTLQSDRGSRVTVYSSSLSVPAVLQAPRGGVAEVNWRARG